MVIVGPSPRFLSGISYYTLRLSNALSLQNQVTSLLFRDMLPKRLFPGWRRIGTDLSSQKFDPQVRVLELLDWYNPATWVIASRIIRDAEVLILEWWTSSVAHMFLALLVLNRGRTPVLMEFHEVVDPFEFSVGPIRVYARVMGRLIRGMAHRYVVHSEHDRKLIASHYHISEERITVIPHGLYDHYPVLSKEKMKAGLGVQNSFVFLFFGLIRPYKGVKTLIRAFEKLPSDIKLQSKLYIVGEAWEDSDSIVGAATSPDAERINLINRYVSDEEIPTFFSAADALVLPYIRASQSGVAHIGISYGMPIIASQVGGLVESLSEYEGATLVEPSDEEKLCKAMKQVFTNGYVQYPVPANLRWSSVARKFSSEICMAKDGSI